ncbi:hypothetical protein Tco_1193346 [Tanacetum coccineum]
MKASMMALVDKRGTSRRDFGPQSSGGVRIVGHDRQMFCRRAIEGGRSGWSCENGGGVRILASIWRGGACMSWSRLRAKGSYRLTWVGWSGTHFPWGARSLDVLTLYRWTAVMKNYVCCGYGRDDTWMDQLVWVEKNLSTCKAVRANNKLTDVSGKRPVAAAVLLSRQPIHYMCGHLEKAFEGNLNLGDNTRHLVSVKRTFYVTYFSKSNRATIKSLDIQQGSLFPVCGLDHPLSTIP